jgi:hypothetical protein
MEGGAAGYLLKDSPAAALAEMLSAERSRAFA